MILIQYSKQPTMTTLKELRETYHLKRAIFTNINDQFLYKIDTRIFAMDKKINDILYKLIETNIIFSNFFFFKVLNFCKLKIVKRIR